MRENVRETRATRPVESAEPTLGPSLKALRTAAGMTLEEVCAAAGVGLSYLSRAERNLVKPTDGWIAMVAVAIGKHLAREPVARTG